MPERSELPLVAGTRYVAFCDPAGGGGGDSMTLAIAHTERRGDCVGVLDLVRERKPLFSPEAVVQEFAATLAVYQVRQVTADRYAGSWPSEQFAKRGITCVASERTKTEIYGAFLPALNSGAIELLDDRRLIAQLLGLERRVARGGRDSIDHGPHGHDDVVNAACGAVVLALATGSFVGFPIAVGSHSGGDDDVPVDDLAWRGWGRTRLPRSSR